MKPSFLAPLALGLLLFTAGCDFSADDEDTSGIVTLTGRVLNEADNNAVPNAFVHLAPYDLLVETDETGRYHFADVKIDSTMSLVVSAYKDGFSTDEETVLALAGREIAVPTMHLTRTAEPEPESGEASNILLLEQSSQNIGVVGSGSEEVANVTFRVADSLGRPVILDHNAAVHFKLGVRPGGGEFIFPESAQTDNNGQVKVNLSSGTKAGVVQLVAETVVNGRTIVSRPVSVAIHGGLPDQRHFSVGPAQFNFPGLLAYGLTNEIAIIVGDKYANPVKPGTAVYFTSTAGIIQGSALTDEGGRGSAILTSGNPLPPDGVAVITATTADEEEQVVSAQIPVLFSGSAVVRVEPAVARLGQTYTLTVHDRNGNPLAPGTSISVEVEGTKVKGVGHTSVELGDTIFGDGFRDHDGDGVPDGVTDGDPLDYDDVMTGPGRTVFTFSAVEDAELDEAGTSVVEAITIVVAGPNGKYEIVLPKGSAGKAGSPKAYALTKGLIAVELPNGGMEFRMDK